MKTWWIFLTLFVFTISSEASSKISLYGHKTIPNGTVFQDTLIGGLSALFFNPKTQMMAAISDDPGRNSDNRFYEFLVDYETPSLIEIQSVYIFHPENNLRASVFLDAEGMVQTPSGHTIISSETLFDGSKNFHKIFNHEGEQIGAFSVGDKFLPGEDVGIQENKGFEGLTASPDASILWTANEEHLLQDKIKDRNLVRLIKLRKKNQYEVEAEYAYELEQIPFARNGLSEMLYLSENKLLTLERAHNYVLNLTTVQLFEVEIKDDTNYQDTPSFKTLPFVRTVKKKLLLNFKDLNLPKVDNLEGMTLGPLLPNGNRTLIIVSDNNFNPLQITQFIFLELED